MTAPLRQPAEAQASSAVLMIRPAHFASNQDTAGSNFFQQPAADTLDAAERARSEFDRLASALAGAGIRVHQFEGRAAPRLPDEVFPNNWLSLHADGTAVLYPLLATNRRPERRPDILAALHERHGYRVGRIVDLTHLEARHEFLEGTGSLVLDRTSRVAYACLSPRTHTRALAAFARGLDYDTVPFRALDRAGRPIYHTNVLLSVGTHFAVLCTRAVAETRERRSLIRRLETSGREVIDIDFDHLEAFAGNLLELEGRDGAVIALSERACASLGDEVLGRIGRYGRIVAAAIPTIETLGGGSVRCMLAEVALPRA